MIARAGQTRPRPRRWPALGTKKPAAGLACDGLNGSAGDDFVNVGWRDKHERAPIVPLNHDLRVGGEVENVRHRAGRARLDWARVVAHVNKANAVALLGHGMPPWITLNVARCRWARTSLTTSRMSFKASAV